MPFAYRFEDYSRYRRAVGEATYIDLTRRGDAARQPQAWHNLAEVLDAAGAPWVVQVWTKDPVGVVAIGSELMARLRRAGTTLTAQVTVTGLAGTAWEPLVPADAQPRLPRLLEALGGPEHCTWRYDPVIPTVHDLERFRRLAESMAALGVRRLVFNFLAPPGRYRRVDRRLVPLLPGWAEGMPGYDADWRRRTASSLVQAAVEAGLEPRCCAESADLAEQVPGLGAAACGDHGWFARLSGRDPARAATRGSRPGCGCARYFDVGAYGQWRHCRRCVYCYAG